MQKNSKNFLLVGVIVAIFAIGSLWWENRNAEAPPLGSSGANGDSWFSPISKKTTALSTSKSLPTVTPDGIYLVYYVKTGFSPQMLTIPRGKSVRFINNSGGKSMRVGSTDSGNIVYSAFNQGKTVGAGGTYEYTFVDKGTYSYNNKNNPTDQGIIVVQ